MTGDAPASNLLVGFIPEVRDRDAGGEPPGVVAMSTSLKAKLASKTAALKKDIEALLAAHGNTVIADVTISQAYGGMRDIKCMVTETSSVDPQEGIRYRGHDDPGAAGEAAQGARAASSRSPRACSGCC